VETVSPIARERNAKYIGTGRDYVLSRYVRVPRAEYHGARRVAHARILQNRQKEFANLALAPFRTPPPALTPFSSPTPKGCIMTGCIMQDGYADELSVRHT